MFKLSYSDYRYKTDKCCKLTKKYKNKKEFIAKKTKNLTRIYSNNDRETKNIDLFRSYKKTKM